MASGWRSASGEQFRLPAEFEPQRAIWMAWPTYENRRGHPVDDLIFRLIAAARGRVGIELLVRDDQEAGSLARRLAGAGVTGGVRLHPVPHVDIWMRDTGPVFLTGDRGGLRIARFGFNMWGYESRDSPASRLEGAIAERIAERLGIPVVCSPLISEGGARDTNGAGTLLLVEAVETQRNPEWTTAEIEAEYRRVLGVTRILWLAEGMAEDDLTTGGPLPGGVWTAAATGGHVDEFARFADPRTILLAEVAPEDRERDEIAARSHERLEENHRRLLAARDPDGRPFRILRLPTPDPMFATLEPGDGLFDFVRKLARTPTGQPIPVVAAASYANFHVTNGLVFAPLYARPGSPESVRMKDEKARRVLSAAFPGRRVLGFDPRAANFGGGGIHCMTQHEPVRAAG